MARTPTDPTKAQVWITKGIDELDFEFYFPQGPKGDPGGFTSGTLLGTTDLNSIKSAGLYRQDSGAEATSGRNYPITSGGTLSVMEMAGTNYLVQSFYPVKGDTSAGRTIYRREFATPNWSSWRAHNATRVDQTAGRAIYQWDDVNNREQLIYGDTGWRDISSLMINGWTGTLFIRRSNQTVTLYGMLNGTSRTSDHFIATASISGFKPRPNTPFGTAQNVSNDTIKVLNNDATDLFITSGAATTYTLYATYLVGDTVTWPSTLPGSASGTVPNT